MPRAIDGIFAEIRLKKIAEKFAATYKAEGEMAAAKYLEDNVDERLYVGLQPYVQAALEKLGYKF